MITSTALRDRLPSALAALALQAEIIALLALSFAVVQQLPPEKETIFTLPPLARPKPPPPLVIDGRKSPPPPAAPAPPLFIPAVTVPGLAVPPRVSIPMPQSGTDSDTSGLHPPTHQDATQELLHPPQAAKDTDHWSKELAKERAPPPRVPCVDIQRNVIGMGASAREDKTVHLSLLCTLQKLMGADGDGTDGIPFSIGGPPPPRTDNARATDAQFKAALAAANARHGVRAAPALTSASQQEGDHAQTHTDIPGGGIADPAGADFGSGGR